MLPVRASLPVLLLSAVAAHAQPPAAGGAGNRMTPLPMLRSVSAEQAETLSALHCNRVGSLCLRAWREAEGGTWFVDVHNRVPTAANIVPVTRIALPPGEDPDRETHRIWPHVVEEASGALLFGVERYRTAGFSGGGASATRLLLFRLPTETVEASEVLSVQTGYTAMIRACFSEADYNSGRPCHQELELSGTVTLAPNAEGRPRFVLVTAARVFPRGSLREGWESRPYRRADSVWERDPACSYRRIFAFSAASGRYAPDRPLPDCSTYSLP
jgi:hypothetical protein